MNMKEELLRGLSEEQIAKLKSCKGQEEILKIAKEEGVELTDEQLEAVSGGCGGSNIRCPDCGSEDLTILATEEAKFCCRRCGKIFSKLELFTAVPVEK